MHVLCAVIVYCFWMSKPLDVATPIPVGSALAADHADSFDASPKRPARPKDGDHRFAPPKPPLVWYAGNYEHLRTYLDTVTNLNLFNAGPRPWWPAGAADRTPIWRLEHHLAPRLALVLLCVAYGGLHLAAWNFHFPSWGERFGWIISSMVLLAGPACSLGTAYLVARTQALVQSLLGAARAPAWLADAYARSWRWSQLAFIALLALCRVFLIVESFVSLRMVPAGVYQDVPWTTHIQHF